MWCITSTNDIVNIQTGVKIRAENLPNGQWALMLDENILGSHRWYSQNEAQNALHRLARENGGLIVIAYT